MALGEITYPNWLANLLGGGASSAPVLVATMSARLALSPTQAKGNQVVQSSDQTVWMLKSSGSPAVEADWVWVGRTQPKFLGVVTSEATMLALVGVPGDFCFRSDLRRRYDLIALPISTLESWVVSPELNKSDVGLPNVNNTADSDKPVSGATAAVLALKLNASVVTPAGTDADATHLVGGDDSRLDEWEKPLLSIGGNIILEMKVSGPRFGGTRFHLNTDEYVSGNPATANYSNNQVNFLCSSSSTFSLAQIQAILAASPSLSKICSARAIGTAGSAAPVSADGKFFSSGKLSLYAIEDLLGILDAKPNFGEVMNVPYYGAPVNQNPGSTASGVITFTAQPTSADFITINGQTYGFYVSGPHYITATKIGAYLPDTLNSLVSNLNSTNSAYYVATRVPNSTSVLITAANGGVSGNALPLSKSGSMITLSGSTLTGGLDAVDGTTGQIGQESIIGTDIYKCISQTPRTWVKLTTASI